jgi:uncharacterized membrane protein YagU involved in acid resistance
VEIRLFLIGIGVALCLGGLFGAAVKIGDATQLEPSSPVVRVVMVCVGLIMILGCALARSRPSHLPWHYRLARLLVSVTAGFLFTLIIGGVAFVLVSELHPDTKITGDWSGDLFYAGSTRHEVLMTLNALAGEDARTGWMTINHINGSCRYRLAEESTGSHRFDMTLVVAEPRDCPPSGGQAHLILSGLNELSLRINDDDRTIADGKLTRSLIMSP